MAENRKEEKSVFQTPNPAELKQAAKEDPIQEREGNREADVYEGDALDSEMEEQNSVDRVVQAGVMTDGRGVDKL